MTRCAYIVGGAATGKSTFMGDLLDVLGAELGPVEDIWTAPKTNGAKVKLRGHYWPATQSTSPDGLYLGVKREIHPGADGLDKACQPAALAWAASWSKPPMVVGEGALLSNREFLDRLPNLLVVLLTASPEEQARRCVQRGTSQAPSFIAGTTTRARNAYEAHHTGLTVDTEDRLNWATSVNLVADWLDLG
jgi:hypothetical protein